MLNIGMSEILLFAIIALIVLGPEKLPEAARFAGQWYGKIKRTINSVQQDIDRELRMSELRDQMQQELARIQELEQKMHAQLAHMEAQSSQAVTEKFPVRSNHVTTYQHCRTPIQRPPLLKMPHVHDMPYDAIELKKAV